MLESTPLHTRRSMLRFAIAATGCAALPMPPARASCRTDPPAGAAGSAPGITFQAIEPRPGLRLRVAELGDVAKPALVCLHGFTDSWHSFRPVMPLLAQTHRIIAPDMRGHGESTAPGGEFALDALAGDVIAIMDSLRIDSAAIVGHSYGSFVARRVVMTAPQRVRRVVLVGAGLTADNGPVRALISEIAEQGDVIPRAFAETFQAGTVLDRALVPEWFFRACVDASMAAPASTWRGALASLVGDQRTGGDVNLPQPTLVIGGERDAVFSIDEQRRLASAIPGARLTLYRHCGHAPNWEQPQRFAEDVQSFVVTPA